MASSLSGAPQKAIALPRPARTPIFAPLIEAEQSRWLLFAPVALGVGIALWFLLPFVAQRQVALLLSLAVALLGLAFSGLTSRLLFAAGLLAALGILVAEVRSLSVAAPVLHHRLGAATLTGELLALEARAGGERWRMLLLRDASGTDPAVRLRISLSTPPPPGIEPGARVAVSAILQPRAGPVLPGAHDAARAAWFDGISASGRATAPPVLLAPAPANTLWLARARADITRFLQQRIGGDAGRVAAALVTGDQGQVPAPLLESMRISGLAHLLSVSGFHIAVVAGGALLLFRKALALWPWLALRISVRAVAAILAGLAATAYAILAGAEVPAVRAAITAWIVLLALAFGRDPLSLRLIAFAACCILLLRPEALLSPSFQLSFAAVTTLALLAKSAFAERFMKSRPEDGALPKFARYALALIVSSLLAELILSPIAMAHFGRAGAYGVFANMLAIPLTSLAIMPLLAAFLASAVAGVEALVLPPLRFALESLIAVATHVATLPGASVAVPALPLAASLLAVCGALLLGLLAGRLRWLGLPLLVAGLLVAFFKPRSDLFVSPDGRQVAIVQDGGLYFLRTQRGGFTARAWSEASAAPAAGLIAHLPQSRCSEGGCATRRSGLSLLILKSAPASSLASACAAADIVIAPTGLANCTPRWLLLDSVALHASGAVAVHTPSRRFTSVADRSGDHPWSPAALPGQQQTLLGVMRWTPPLTE